MKKTGKKAHTPTKMNAGQVAHVLREYNQLSAKHNEMIDRVMGVLYETETYIATESAKVNAAARRKE